MTSIASALKGRNPEKRDLSLTIEQLAIFNDNYRLVGDVIRRFTGSGNFYPDYQSLGAEALARAAKLYNPKHDSGASFRTYAQYAIRNAVRTEANRISVQARRLPAVSFDMPLGDDTDRTPQDVLTYHENEPAREFPDTSVLPEKQRIVIDRLREGRTPNEIATELGLSRQAISARQKKAINHLRLVVANEPESQFREFMDRPSVSDGLPSQARHIADVFPTWWSEQNARGWPAVSWRTHGRVSCRMHLSEPRPPGDAEEMARRAKFARGIRDAEKNRFANYNNQTRPDFWAFRDGLRFKERGAA